MDELSENELDLRAAIQRILEMDSPTPQKADLVFDLLNSQILENIDLKEENDQLKQRIINLTDNAS